MIEKQGIANEELIRAKREKRNGSFSDDASYRKQERRNESCDLDYNDYEDGDRYHNRKIQDERPAWMAQTRLNANDSRAGGRTETATHVYCHENHFD